MNNVIKFLSVFLLASCAVSPDERGGIPNKELLSALESNCNCRDHISVIQPCKVNAGESLCYNIYFNGNVPKNKINQVEGFYCQVVKTENGTWISKRMISQQGKSTELITGCKR